MGSPRILSIWPSFSVSPVLTSFKFSSIVVGAVEKNLELFGISSPSRIEGQPKPGAIKQTSSVMSDLITLHVRRLDYKDRASDSSGYILCAHWLTSTISLVDCKWMAGRRTSNRSLA